MFGIIIVVMLKFFLCLVCIELVFVGMDSVGDVVMFLGLVKCLFGNVVIVFEILFCIVLECVLEYVFGICDLLESEQVWYVLCEFSFGCVDGVCEMLEEVLGEGFEQGFIKDGVIVENEIQVRDFWCLCESIVEVECVYGCLVKYDVFILVFCMVEFIECGSVCVMQVYLDVVVFCFGYVGDGNVYFNFVFFSLGQVEEFMVYVVGIFGIVYDMVVEFDGFILVEYGIGIFKCEELVSCKLVDVKVM